MTRRKKNNNFERTKRMAQIWATDHAIVYVSTGEHSHLYNTNTRKLEKATVVQVNMLKDIRWPWSTLLTVFCRESNNKLKMITEQIVASGQQYRFDELALFHVDRHKILYTESCEKMEVLGIGWFAIPRVEEISLDVAEHAFSLLNCWDKDKHKEIECV